MLPFCGYNMGDYFAHWLEIGRRPGRRKLPRIYYVNWFRKNDDGKFIWPGFGENSRVLKWIVERLNGEAEAVRDPDRPAARRRARHRGPRHRRRGPGPLLSVDSEVWREEAALIPAFFETFGDRLPKELWDEYNALRQRLG